MRTENKLLSARKKLGTGYKTLASAIVLQALEDYEVALRKKDEIALNELDEFFESQWCASLTNLDVDYLRERVRGIVANERA